MSVSIRTGLIFFLFISGSSLALTVPAAAVENRQNHQTRRITHLQQRIASSNQKYQRRITKLQYRINRIETRSALKTSGQSYCLQNQLSEKACIDAWIARNNLNYYGDPKNTVYAGGTPLFQETTGRYIDRYWYIRMHYPNLPWWQMQ